MAVMSSAAMREFFIERRPTLGEWLLWTKRDTVATHTSPAWSLVNALLVAAGPMGFDLKAERLEHVQLFNLLGDPTMPLPHPRPVKLEVGDSVRAGGLLHIAGQSPVAGKAIIELCPSVEQRQFPRRNKFDNSLEAGKQFDAVYQAANNPQWASATVGTQNQRFAADLRVPANAIGHCHVRVFIEGVDDFAQGGSDVKILGPTEKSPSSPATTAATLHETR